MDSAEPDTDDEGVIDGVTDAVMPNEFDALDVMEALAVGVAVAEGG